MSDRRTDRVESITSLNMSVASFTSKSENKSYCTSWKTTHRCNPKSPKHPVCPIYRGFPCIQKSSKRLGTSKCGKFTGSFCPTRPRRGLGFSCNKYAKLDVSVYPSRFLVTPCKGKTETPWVCVSSSEDWGLSPNINTEVTPTKVGIYKKNQQRYEGNKQVTN